MLTRKHSIEGKHSFGKAAELFNTLDADAAMRADYAARGRKQADHYSPEVYRERLRDVYQKFL